MFSTNSKTQALNKGYLSSSLTTIGPDWEEEEQLRQLQPLSEDAVSEWIKVGDRTISEFLIELEMENPPEAVPADAENSKEETNNIGNQLSGGAVADWSRVGGNDKIISDFLAESVNTPEAIPASYGDTWKEAGNTGEQSVPTAICSFEYPATGYTCNIGDQIFRNNSSLQQHKLTHGNEYPCNGDMSDNVSETATGSEDDNKHHKRKPLLKCDFCSFTCRFPSQIEQHQAVHSDKRPFECSVCHGTFKRDATLRWHQSSAHVKERPYCCEFCGKTFKKNCHLKRHTAGHSADCVHVCAICNKRYHSSFELNQHQIVHSKVKSYTCQFCQKMYAWPQSLNKHLKQKHNVSQNKNRTNKSNNKY